MKQVASREEQETVILVDYEGGKITVYSNKATVVNKLDTLTKSIAGTEVYEELMSDKSVYAKQFRFPIESMTKLLKMNIFRAT